MIADDRVAALVADLRDEARRANERRLLVVTGERERTREVARRVLSAADPGDGSATILGEWDRDRHGVEQIPQRRADRLLGTTREVVVFDAHDRLQPNALGRVIGAVDGGGLFVLLAPSLDEWPDRTDEFDESLAVEPYDPADVSGNFRDRFVSTLRDHPGVAIFDADRDTVERDGLTDPPPARERERIQPPASAVFPPEAYESCLTGDQAETVAAFERLVSPPDRDGDDSGDADSLREAVVVESDRGRGKSSAAGIAAGALAADGATVAVTAPDYGNAREMFVRAAALLADLGAEGDNAEPRHGSPPKRIESAAGGEIVFRSPPEIERDGPDADVLVVDEAAALPVHTLSATLATDRVAYATTVHGYEGAGRGFSVRFRDRLAESDHRVTECRLDEPIRYAAGDPVESWAFRALLLDARPPVKAVVEDATPGNVEYRQLGRAELLSDEYLLRETFGLLVLAHYRTEPDDLARLLDAPNVTVRGLLYGGHVVSVSLLAEEGNLPASTRARIYEGARIRGHMLPDVLTSQLRDEGAGGPAGLRVLRIATHHAVRSRGLGSRLLGEIRAEFAPGGSGDGDQRRPGDGDQRRPGDGDQRRPGDGDTEAVDYLGVGYGATPELVEFWAENGYRTVHLSTTRNERSGEHSALMIDPLTDRGEQLCERHAEWFVERSPATCTDSLREVDPDVVAAALAAAGVDRTPDLDDRDWRVVAGAAYGPGLYKIDPTPFRDLVVAHLADPDPAVDGELTDRQRRLLVGTILQASDPDQVADELDYHSTGQCLRAVGDALAKLVDHYGGPVAEEERGRYE